MASMTMAATSLLLPSSRLAKNNGISSGRLAVVAKATTSDEKSNLEMNNSNNGRRELMFAGAAMAACSIAKAAMADVEPKAGTPDAKKKYAPICVTMPTAKICHK